MEGPRVPRGRAALDGAPLVRARPSRPSHLYLETLLAIAIGTLVVWGLLALVDWLGAALGGALRGSG